MPDMDISHKPLKGSIQILSFLLSSLILTLFLGYIDEGNYSFEGLFSNENLPAMIIYTSIFFAAQFFIARVVLRSYKGRYLTLYSIGFFLSFLLIMLLLALLNSVVQDKL
ncbi:MAG: hypothetical protein V4561_11635 [Bacteroidota bacterium]